MYHYVRGLHLACIVFLLDGADLGDLREIKFLTSQKDVILLRLNAEPDYESPTDTRIGLFKLSAIVRTKTIETSPKSVFLWMLHVFLSYLSVL